MVLSLSARLLSLLLFVLLCLPHPVVAKPTPPADLMKIFAAFLDGEDFIEEDNWKETDKWLQGVAKDYQRLRPAMSKELPAPVMEKFEKSLEALRDNNSAQKYERNHGLFIASHKAFLDLLDNYDYKLPPLMYLVQNDLKEADSGVKAGELDEVRDELRDVEIFYGQLVPMLQARSVNSTMIESFRAQLIRCKGAAEANNKNLLATELAKLQQLFSVQYQLLTSQK